jgi:stearoyl-CoA desaturase (delta-9 desaturase)
MVKSMLKNIDWRALFVLIIYPIILIFLIIQYCSSQTIGMFEIGLLVAGYYGSNISVGVGLHRLWSHQTFKTNKFVEFILVMTSSGTLQGPVLSWASDHFKHHTYTDQDKDPHSPLKFENKILGFLWSHLGWMLIGKNYKQIDRVTMVKLGRSNILKWQLKYYWQIALFMNTVIPALVGYLFGGTILAAYAGFLFIGMGRAIQQHATFCVNSLCHFIGSKKYYKGTAGDIWWMALFLLGENWHNFHHAFPSDYRNGAKWYQLDVHKWIIYIMSKLGLAWDLQCTTETRIQAKMQETHGYLLEGRKQRLNLLQGKITQLAEHLYTKCSELENSSISIQSQIKKSFMEIQQSLKNLAEQLQSSVWLNDKSSERLLKIASKKVKNNERALYKLYNQLDTKYISQ